MAIKKKKGGFTLGLGGGGNCEQVVGIGGMGCKGKELLI